MMLLSNAARRLFLDRHAEFWLGELSSTLSLHERRARVVDIVDETPDTKTFVLAVPLGRWPGHRAGQYVPVDVEIDGRRVRRCYSITSLPGERRRLAITVKRVPGGLVSNHLHDRAAIGTVVGLGEPAGDFTLPDALPGKLALIAGGSGITPVVAILRDLRNRNLLGRTSDIVAVQAARTTTDAPFARELARLANVRVIAHRDEHAGHLTADSLRALIPDLADRHVMTCGPAPLMDLVERAAGKPVVRERFVGTLPRTSTGATSGDAAAAPKTRVHLAVANRTVELDGRGTLLEQLERAGERPAHGCRMGVCNTCRCTLARGATRDLTTDTTSAEPDTTIRLCTSVAASDELELSL